MWRFKQTLVQVCGVSPHLTLVVLCPITQQEGVAQHFQAAAVVGLAGALWRVDAHKITQRAQHASQRLMVDS